MNNLLSLHYKDAKQKVKCLDSDYHYRVELLNALCQIVRITNFEDITDGIDYDLFQSVKFVDGVVGLAKKENNLYCVFNITEVGLPNNTMRHNHVIGSYYDVNNELHTEEFTVGVDIVLLFNNAFGVGENDIYNLSDMLSEIDTSIMISVNKTRYTDVVEVSNEQEKQNYQKAVRETKDGEPVVFVNKTKNSITEETEQKPYMLNDVKNTNTIQYLSHLHDDILKRFCNKNGLSINMGSSKQAQMTVAEVSGVDAYSWVNPTSMLYQTQQFAKRCKDLYDIEFDVRFGIVHEKNFEKFMAECTKDDVDNNVETETEETSENEERGDSENAETENKDD